MGGKLADGEVEGIKAIFDGGVEAYLDGLHLVEGFANLHLESGVVSRSGQPLAFIAAEFRHKAVKRLLRFEEEVHVRRDWQVEHEGSGGTACDPVIVGLAKMANQREKSVLGKVIPLRYLL